MRKLWMVILLTSSALASAQQGFVGNDGQWDEPFEYVYRFGANALFLTQDSLVFSVLSSEDFHPEHDTDKHHHYADTLHFVHFSVKFPGAGRLTWSGESQMPHQNHFYLGKQSSWRSSVPSFEKLRAKNVYPGIDLLVYSAAGGVKYDWVVSPDADPSLITVAYGGVDAIEVDRKKVSLSTGIGIIEEGLPLAYQGAKEIKAHYEKGENQVKYRLGDYDVSQTLVIDPIYIFSTYSGSSADNFGYTATFDDNGNAFGGGIVFNTGYPTVLGSFDVTFNGGFFDAAISKFSADGSQLLWSAYIGGANLDQPHSLDCDEFGNLYVLGLTGSSDFPTTSNAQDTSFGGGNQAVAEYYTFANGSDMFVSAINSSGTSLFGSSFLGGENNEGFNDSLRFNYGDGFRGEIEVQRGGGYVFVASTADSSGYPVTAGGTTHQGGLDGVFSVLSRNMDSLISSTYVGTSGHEALYSLSIAEKIGNATQSSRIFLAGAIKTTESNLMVAGDSVNINGSSSHNGLLVSLAFGPSISIEAAHMNSGSAYNQHFFVETNHPSDTATLVTLVGQSKGGLVASDSNFWGQPGSAQYFMEFKLDLTNETFVNRKTLVFGDGSNTTIDLSPTALLVDECGNTYFSGWGGSPNSEGTTDGLTTTPGAVRTVTDGRDFYFLVIDPSWKVARLATYYGSADREHVDGGTSRFDARGRIFQGVCAGCGGSSAYPTYPSNVYSSTNGSSNCNLAVTVIDLDIQNARLNVTPVPDEFCLPGNFVLADSSINVQSYTVDWGDGSVQSYAGSIGSYQYTVPGSYLVNVIGQDTVCDTWDTTTFEIQVNPAFDSVWIDYDYDFCDPLRLFKASVRHISDSSLATDYVLDWNLAGATYGTSSVQVTLPTSGANRITLDVLDTNCNFSQKFIDTIVFRPPPFLAINTSLDECETREAVDFNPVYNQAFQYFEWLIDGQSVGSPSPLQITQSGLYEISIVAYDSICGISDTLTEKFDVYFAGEAFDVPNVITPNGDGINDNWLINTSENWDEFYVILFNRWGLKVFETSVINFEWGADRVGKVLSPGVYFYQIEAKNRCGDIREDGTLHITY